MMPIATRRQPRPTAGPREVRVHVKRIVADAPPAPSLGPSFALQVGAALQARLAGRAVDPSASSAPAERIADALAHRLEREKDG